MAITYNAGTNIITITGYTEVTPCTFLDIYNADVAGGWGVITRQCTNQYCASAQINVGDGVNDSYLGDENISLTFTNFTPNSTYCCILPQNHGYVRFGKLTSGLKTEGGCLIRMLNVTQGELTAIGNRPAYPNRYGSVKLYSTIIIGKKTTHPKTRAAWVLHDIEVYNSMLLGGDFSTILNLNIFNTIIKTASFGFQNISGVTSIEDCKIEDVSPWDAIYFHAPFGNMTIKNTDIKNCTYDFCLTQTGGDLYCVNVIVDRAWHFRMKADAGDTRCYRQYEFDLKVTDNDANVISGATVKIWDKNNNLVVDTTTNASGAIATQTLNYGYYNLVGGDTPTMQTPHKIQISKAGYETYKKKWTLDEKTSWTIALHIPKRRFDSLEG